MGDGVELIGRERELGLLAAALADAAEGHGAVVSLSGEAGVGKTATARAFVSFAGTSGATTLWAACFDGAAQPAYGPWLAPMAALGVEATAMVGDLSPAEARLRLFAAVQEAVVAAAAVAPVVVVVDDLHWAGSDSLELFGHLSARVEGSRVVLIGTYRDPDLTLEASTPLAGLVAGLARLPVHVTVRLGGLATAEVGRFLTRALGDDVPAGVVRAVHQETSGNPFYVREVARLLVDEGKLVRGAGRWLTDFSLSDLGIPETVRHAVRGRLAGVSDGTRALLQAGSAFSGNLDLETLRDVAGLSEDDALGAVDQALASGFLQRSGQVDAPYAFAHAIVREALADAMNPDRAARLHRRAAESLERLRPDEHGGIGEQYWLSRTLPGAAAGVAHCLAAADSATGVHASRHTARLLEFALDLTPATDADTRLEILARLAVAQAEALDAESAVATTQAVAERAAPAEAADVILRVAEALREGAPATAWLPLVRRGLELVGDARDARWARLVIMLDPVETVGAGPLRVGRWTGFPAEALAALVATGLENDEARAIEPFRPRSEAETEALRLRSARWSSPRARMRALDLVGRDLSLRHGQPAAAVACYRQLLELGDRFGSLPARAEASAQLALCLALTGDVPEAEEHLTHSIAMVRDLWPGHRLHLLGTVSSSTVLAYMVGEGDWAALRWRLSAWLNGPAPPNAPFANVFAALAAVCHAFAGDRSEARFTLGHLTDVLAALRPSDHAVAGSLWFGTAAAWEIADHNAARRLLPLVHRHRREGGPPGPASVEHAAGRLAAMLGDDGAAATAFSSARAAAVASGSRGVGALIDFDDAARQGDAEGVRGAARTFGQLGMRGWAARAQAWTAPLAPARPSRLTDREMDVLRHLAAGHTSQEISQRLFVSAATVNRHIANIYVKIDVRNRAEATAFAIAHGLVRLPST